MYAIIATGGKQFKVEKDQIIKVEKLDANKGDKVTLDVVMLADDGKVLVGDDLKRPKSRRKFCTATNPIRLSFTNTKPRRTNAERTDTDSRLLV